MKYIVTAVLLFLLFPQTTYASTKLAAASATIASVTITEEDNRAKTLEVFLQKYNSPMINSAPAFIEEADKNNIDWRLLAAIAGVESTFGKRIPQGTNNAWGWGIYGNNRIYFESFDDGIATISKALREKYINRIGSDNVYAIGRVYAASPTWAMKVEKFMNMIQSTHEASTSSKLTINL